MCEPLDRSVKSDGTGQALNAAPSSEHSNVAAGSSLSKAKLAVLLSLVLGGPKTIVVSGGSNSTTDHS